MKPRYDIVDSHLHFLDFTQDSDGFPALTKAMDLSGVSEAVVFGMPMVKKWDYLMPNRPLYYMSNDSRCYYYSGTDHLLANELLSLPEEMRKRFHPFCCGFACTDTPQYMPLTLTLSHSCCVFFPVSATAARFPTCGPTPNASSPWSSLPKPTSRCVCTP